MHVMRYRYDIYDPDRGSRGTGCHSGPAEFHDGGSDPLYVELPPEPGAGSAAFRYLWLSDRPGLGH